MKLHEGKILYDNGMFKVVYMDFGVCFGKLYGVFSNDAIELSSCTVVCGCNSLRSAVRNADYLAQFNKYGLHKNSD